MQRFQRFAALNIQNGTIFVHYLLILYLLFGNTARPELRLVVPAASVTFPEWGGVGVGFGFVFSLSTSATAAL
jgi:hypothetical protein